MKVIPETRLAQ